MDKKNWVMPQLKQILGARRQNRAGLKTLPIKKTSRWKALIGVDIYPDPLSFGLNPDCLFRHSLPRAAKIHIGTTAQNKGEALQKLDFPSDKMTSDPRHL